LISKSNKQRERQPQINSLDLMQALHQLWLRQDLGLKGKHVDQSQRYISISISWIFLITIRCRVRKLLNIKKVWNKYLKLKFQDFCLIITKLKLEWWTNNKQIVMQIYLVLVCLQFKFLWKKSPLLTHVAYQHVKDMWLCFIVWRHFRKKLVLKIYNQKNYQESSH